MRKSVLFCLMMASVLWGVGGAAMEPMPKLNELDQKLFSLVKEGSVDIDELKELCEQGANIFAVDPDDDNVSLLHIVVSKNSKELSGELLDILLTLGKEQDSKKVAAWCNLQTKDQAWTALHFAAFEGALGCIASLLKAGANPNIIEKMCNTPVGAALHKNNVPCAGCLLDHKNFDFTQKHGPIGATILYDVCKIGKVGYVKLVVEKAKKRMKDDEFRQWLNASVIMQMPDGSHEQVPVILSAALKSTTYQDIVEYLSEEGVSTKVTFLGEVVQVDNVYAIAQLIEKVTGKSPIIRG